MVEQISTISTISMILSPKCPSPYIYTQPPPELLFPHPGARENINKCVKNICIYVHLAYVMVFPLVGPWSYSISAICIPA